jgi:hypothetical protein
MATVEGVFKIIDRASGPLRKMEAQARKTEAALKSTGDRLDNVGDRSQLRQMEQAERQMRNVGREAQVMERNVSRSGTAMRRTRGETRDLATALTKLGGVFAGLRALRIPALIIGIASVIKPLVAIVGALGGGITALLPKLTDLGGVAGALPATFAGLGLAMGTAKLAFSDLGKAMSGNKKAMERLTPEARSFLRTLKQYKPVVDDLRKTAQKGLFPGLEYSVRRLQRAVPVIRNLIGRMSREMGRQAGDWANFLTTPGRLRDFNTIGEQGIRVFRRISEGARNLSAALIDIAVAARPFTEWLTKRLLAGTRAFRDFIHQGRESGRLTQFFDRTRDAVERFWSIAKNLFGVLRGIGKAARPLGEDLWRSFDRITRGWNRWVNSTRGQHDLKTYFDGLRPTLHELGGLVGDLSKALFRLSGPESQRQTAGMVHQLREWVPVLESIFNNATAAFGPALLDGIKELGRLLNNLIGPGGGALTMFVRSLTQVLTVVNGLLEAFPALARVATAAFTLFALSRLITRLRSFGSEVGGLARKWMGVKRAADQAAASEERAAGVPMRGGPVAGGGGGRRGAAGAMVGPGGSRYEYRQVPGTGQYERVAVQNPGAATAPAATPFMAGYRRAGGGAAGVRGGFQSWRQNRSTNRRLSQIANYGSSFQNRERARRILAQRTARGGGGSLLGALGTGGAALGSRALGAAGGFMLPAAGFGFVLGAASTPGGVGNRMMGGLNMGSFGLIPGPQQLTPDEASSRAQTGVLESARTGHMSGWDVSGYGGQSYNVRAPLGMDPRTHRDVRNPLAGRGGLPGIDTATGEFTGRGVSVRQARAVGAGLQQQIGRVTTEAKTATGERHASLMGELTALKQLQAGYKGVEAAAHQRKRAEVQRSRDHARDLLQQFGQAYDIYSRRFGPQVAMQKTVHGVIGSMRAMKPAGAKVLAENTLAWAQQQAKSNPKLRGQVDKLTDAIKDRFTQLGRHVQIVNGRILTGSESEWKSIRDGITSKAEQAKQQASDSFTALQQMAVGSLRAMGFSNTEAKNIVQNAESGGTRGNVATKIMSTGTGVPYAPGAIQNATSAPKHHKKGARGMRVPGTGTQDNVPIYGYGGDVRGIVAPGELLVANRHTEKRIDKMLAAYGTSMDREVAGEHKPHSAPAFATGGEVRKGNALLAGVHSGVASVVESILGKFPGLSVTSTTGGGHAKGSYHYRGEAVDIGGAPDLMNRAASWVGRSMGAGLTEGIHNPNLSIKNGANVPASFWGPAVWGEHANHIHVAVAGGGPVAGAASGTALPGGTSLTMQPLRAPTSNLGGAPGAMANAAGAMYAKGMTQRIQKMLDAQGGVPGGGGGGASSAGGQYDKAALASLWVRAGGPRDVANLMGAIALAESGGNPSIVNSIGASGLWQIHPGGKQYLDPMTNAQTAVSKYSTQGLGAWEAYTNGAYRKYMARGGRVGQSYVPFGGAFGDGADFIATRPQSIVVGDKGKERVTVSPTGKGGHGGRVVLKPIFHIHGGERGNVEREVERALKKVARELDLVTQEDED